MSKICQMLETFSLWVGSKPTWDAEGGSCIVSVPAKAKRKRYTFAELMEGVTPERIQALNAEIAWALEGMVVGKELI